MLTVKLCSELDDNVIFETFKEGFSDYFLKVDLTKEKFLSHFFGSEGNKRELSFVVFKGEKPAGILLAGIRDLDGIKTIRCGGMSVIPSARKRGIAKIMMATHEAMAKDAGVHQMFLEVLTVNESAYKFYESIGYEKVYDLTYRTFKPSSKWLNSDPDEELRKREEFYSIQKITLTDLEALRRVDGSHLPWQESIETVAELEAEVFGVFKNGKLIAGLIGNKTKLYYVYVLPSHRLEGVGTAILKYYVQECEVESCTFVYSNNAKLHTFANHLEMETSEFGQYEYYKWLDYETKE